MPQSPDFIRETKIERLLNQSFGYLLRLGIGLSHNYLLVTVGRKTGKLYSTPVNLLEMNRSRYLVASRGETGWVRNARAAGTVTLKKGAKEWSYRIRELPVPERPPIIKEFLERFAASVQRFYEVPKGSPVEAFVSIAPRNPVFELIA